MERIDAKHLIDAVEGIGKTMADTVFGLDEVQIDSIMAEVARIVAVAVIAVTGDSGKPLTAAAKAELAKMAKL